MSGYPYDERPLSFSWGDRKCQLLAVCTVLAAGVATWLQWPVTLARIDDWTLRVAFPAALAIVLAFAPRPSTLVGRIAKDLTVVGIAAAMFGGDLVPAMIVCYPLVLALSVALGETGLGAKLWRESARDAAG